MSHLRRARQRTRPASDHERARRLAAESLHDPLGPEQGTWLADHLADCPACAAVALDYEDQRAALRALPRPEPPRDLWARTSAALDAEERRAAGGQSRFGLGAVAPGRLVPYGALAGALVVAVVVGSSLLSTGPAPSPDESAAPPSAFPSVAAAPTPVAVAADNVAWLAPQEDGTYALNVAPVDRVCPVEAQPDCAPIDGSARQVVRLSAAPRAVLRSPNESQIAIVDAATTSVGGSIYMVGISSSPEPTNAPGANATPIATPIAIATAPASAPPFPEPSPSPPVEPSTAPSIAPSASALEPSIVPSESAVPATPPASAAPSETPPGTAVEIISDVVVVGDTAAYSPDGAWFAFSARPTDGGQGPDIYVWHVGDAAAHPITTDHASVFSAWFGSLVLGSTVLPDASPAASPGAVEVSPGPETSDSPEESLPVDGGLVPVTPLPSDAAGASGPPATAPTSPDGTDEGAGTGACCLPFPSAGPEVPTGSPISFLIDPSTGGRAGLWMPAWRPVPDPSGRYVVYWTGTLGFDAATSTWTPLDGQLVIAPWWWLATGGPQAAGATGSPGEGLVLPDASPSPDASGLLPSDRPTATDGLEPASAAPFGSAPLASPSLQPLPPIDGASPSAAPTPFPPLTSPEPLLAPTGDVPTAPYHDWDVHFDPTGTRLAVWIGDPLDTRLGRLSLLTVDQPTGQIDRAASLLIDAPALGGFSIGDGRLAWASPPGQDGEGSRLLVMGWNASGTGQVDGQPVIGGEEVVVVR